MRRILLILAALGGLWWLLRGGAGVAALAAVGFGGGAKGQPAETGPRPVVVLSPGHGWWSESTGAIDPGDQAGGLTEKDVALDVARQAQEMLARCPVDVSLTRTGDDDEHSLATVHEIVNGQQPRLAVALHTSSADALTGPLAWYTVGGADDEGSRRLADRLTWAVADRLRLAPRGAWPETAAGGLYIHPWQTTAVLIELGSVGADATPLRDERREFARAVTQAVLDELGLPVSCAGAANPQGWPVSIVFPDETLSANLTLKNDGLTAWDPANTTLQIVGDSYGAAASYALPAFVGPGDSATWAIPARAPGGAGVYEQQWQLVSYDAAGQPVAVGAPVALTLVVVPPEARALKDRLDQKMAEVKEAGAAKADELVQDMKDELKAWAVEQAQQQAAKCVGVSGALVVAGVFIAGSAKQRDDRRRATDDLKRRA